MRDQNKQLQLKFTISLIHFITSYLIIYRRKLTSPIQFHGKAYSEIFFEEFHVADIRRPPYYFQTYLRAEQGLQFAKFKAAPSLILIDPLLVGNNWLYSFRLMKRTLCAPSVPCSFAWLLCASLHQWSSARII